jgi:type III restriction enzyme
MAVIEDPILNSPFREPTRYFKFDDDGITNEILNGRRPSSYFIPIAWVKKKGTEYAEMYGVPFSFIPCSGSDSNPRPGPTPTRVRALEDRIACEITFPRLLGYRYDVPSERLSATFSDDSKLALSTVDIPTRTENAPIVGERSIHTLDDLKRHRENEVAFLLAKLTLEKYFRRDNEPKTDRPSAHRFDADVKGWLFPQVLAIAKRWLAECVTCKDNTFPQLLLLVEFAHDAADRIFKAIVESAAGTPALKPIPRPYDVVGSTRLGCGGDDTRRPATGVGRRIATAE